MTKPNLASNGAVYYTCILSTAAEKSMPDKKRCWQDIHVKDFWRTNMFYPFPLSLTHTASSNWKSTLKSRTHTHTDRNKQQQVEKHLNISEFPVSARPLGGLTQGVAMAAPYYELDCAWVFVSVGLPRSLLAKGNIGAPLASGTQKVSWSRAQVNAQCVPAGVVSASPGQLGQAPLCPPGRPVWLLILTES